MLVLKRYVGEKILIDGGRIVVTLVETACRNGRPFARIGIQAPHDVTVHREEVQVKIDRQESPNWS